MDYPERKKKKKMKIKTCHWIKQFDCVVWIPFRTR